MEEMVFHRPVLLAECLEALNLKDDSVVLDVTCGEGGHSLEILKRLPRGRLLCIDRNQAILNKARTRLSDYPNARFYNLTFDCLNEALTLEGLTAIDAILADLGISMFHYKEDGAGYSEDVFMPVGFSFNDERGLDMRLEEGLRYSALEVVNRFKDSEIADILYRYGEEKESRKIAKGIVGRRPIKNARELSELVAGVKREPLGKIHPATRTFQALRIFVNDELGQLERFLPLAISSLRLGGRLAVISYHSLEDRIVKHTLRRFQLEGKGRVLTKKPVIADLGEIKVNKASRSAKLRIFETGNEEQ